MLQRISKLFYVTKRFYNLSTNNYIFAKKKQLNYLLKTASCADNLQKLGALFPDYFCGAADNLLRQLGKTAAIWDSAVATTAGETTAR